MNSPGHQRTISMRNRDLHHTPLSQTCSCLLIDLGVPRQSQQECVKLPSAQIMRLWLRKVRLDRSGKMSRFMERIWSMLVANTKSGSSGVKNVQKLPEESLVEILGRLPLRNLAQCRAVCKEWHRIIDGIWKCDLGSDTCVVQPEDTCWLAFLSDLESPTPIGFSWRDGVPPYKLMGRNLFTTLPFFQSHGVHRVLATSGALVLCELDTHWERSGGTSFSNANGSYMPMLFAYKLMVCNPLKAECFTILPEHANYWLLQSFGIVHDEIMNTFKVIILTHKNLTGDGFSQIEVYSSVTKSFEVIDASLTSFPFGNRGISYKQFVLFVTTYSSDHAIHVFDSDKHSWFIIKLPETVMNSQLEVHGDRLFLMGEIKDYSIVRPNSMHMDLIVDDVKVWESPLTSEYLDHTGSWWLPVSTLSLKRQAWGRVPGFIDAKTIKKLGLKFDKSQIRMLTFFRRDWNHVLSYNIDEDTWYESEILSQGRPGIKNHVPIETFKVSLRLDSCVCREFS